MWPGCGRTTWHSPPKKIQSVYRRVSRLPLKPGVGLYHAAFTCCSQAEQPLGEAASPSPARLAGVPMAGGWTWRPFPHWVSPGALTEARAWCQDGPKGCVSLVILQNRSRHAGGASHQLRGHLCSSHRVNRGVLLAKSCHVTHHSRLVLKALQSVLI